MAYVTKLIFCHPDFYTAKPLSSCLFFLICLDFVWASSIPLIRWLCHWAILICTSYQRRVIFSMSSISLLGFWKLSAGIWNGPFWSCLHWETLISWSAARLADCPFLSKKTKVDPSNLNLNLNTLSGAGMRSLPQLITARDTALHCSVEKRIKNVDIISLHRFLRISHFTLIWFKKRKKCPMTGKHTVFSGGCNVHQ